MMDKAKNDIEMNIIFTIHNKCGLKVILSDRLSLNFPEHIHSFNHPIGALQKGLKSMIL